MSNFTLDLVFFIMIVGMFTTITCTVVLAYLLGHAVGTRRGKEVTRYEQDRD